MPSFPYPFDFDVQPFVIVGAFQIECHHAAFHKNNYFLNIRKQSAIIFLKFRKRSTAHVFCKIHKRSRNVFHKYRTPHSIKQRIIRAAATFVILFQDTLIH